MLLGDFQKYGSAAEKLGRAIRAGMPAHAYILEGDYNVPKLAFARAAAKALVCPEMPGTGCGHCSTCRKIENGNYEDLYEVIPSDTTGKNTGIYSVKDEQIDRLIGDLMMKPAAGPRNLAIITEADSMTSRAQNHLLKTLEEPYPGTVIMLLSENRDKLLNTIQSRCVTLRLNDVDRGEDGVMQQLAGEILRDIAAGAYFYDMEKKLEDALEKRADAYAFFDAMEAALGKCLRGAGPFPPELAASCVSSVEAARRAVQGNGIYKYAAKNLLLKLEDAAERAR